MVFLLEIKSNINQGQLAYAKFQGGIAMHFFIFVFSFSTYMSRKQGAQLKDGRRLQVCKKKETGPLLDLLPNVPNSQVAYVSYRRPLISTQEQDGDGQAETWGSECKTAFKILVKPT